MCQFASLRPNSNLHYRNLYLMSHGCHLSLSLQNHHISSQVNWTQSSCVLLDSLQQYQLLQGHHLFPFLFALQSFYITICLHFQISQSIYNLIISPCYQRLTMNQLGSFHRHLQNLLHHLLHHCLRRLSHLFRSKYILFRGLIRLLLLSFFI